MKGGKFKMYQLVFPKVVRILSSGPMSHDPGDHAPQIYWGTLKRGLRADRRDRQTNPEGKDSWVLCSSIIIFLALTFSPSARGGMWGWAVSLLCDKLRVRFSESFVAIFSGDWTSFHGKYTNIFIMTCSLIFYTIKAHSSCPRGEQRFFLREWGQPWRHSCFNSSNNRIFREILNLNCLTAF